MKSLVLLWQTVAKDFATRCCTSTTMDCKTVHCRVEHEGISFLTITLPSLSKDLQKALDIGMVDRSLFSSYRKKGRLPRFLGGFFDLVFDRTSGRLLNEPDIDAILAIRQLSLLFSKLSLPCSDARTRKAMNDYIKCEQDVRLTDSHLSRSDLADFERIAGLLFRGTFTRIDREVYTGEVLPKHGPGATADSFRGNGKYHQNSWTSRMERIFPCGEYLLPSWSFYDQLSGINILEPGQEIPVRVISVPKTLKTPRIIGVEPTCMQYMQQALMPLFLDGYRKVDYLHAMLGFDDQTPNQRMAHRGSLNGDLATLDLSEASDRVSNQLVRSLFRYHPHLHEGVDACRSRKADVPGKGVIRLAKFASMGSALTFPIEATVFLTIIFVGIERELKRPLRLSDVKHLIGSVRVYGDDIIVPVDYVRSVAEALEDFGLQVNLHKSYWNGKFRESCGKEYYDGFDVSVVKLRHTLPTQRKHATEVISLVSFRNQCYFAGYWETARYLDEKIGKLLRYFPVVLPTSPVLGRHSFLRLDLRRYKHDVHTQSPIVKGFVVSAISPPDHLEGYGALLKCLQILERKSKSLSFSQGGLPSVDCDHLERAGRPHAVDIKLRKRASVI